MSPMAFALMSPRSSRSSERGVPSAHSPRCNPDPPSWDDRHLRAGTIDHDHASFLGEAPAGGTVFSPNGEKTPLGPVRVCSESLFGLVRTACSSLFRHLGEPRFSN